ncbi:MAG: glucan 1,6-alpha-isomaltosidase [Muribaculaceae bacterium]|nr:glucan 1,6-alpha-isomaltosidase [Muribaculaceae bacterium]
MKKMNILASAALTTVALTGCNDDIEMRRPPKFELPELPVVEDIHQYKAPMYWSVYEYCYVKEQQGVSNSDMDITPSEWDKIIEWVATDLKPYGYDMVCTDGFIPMLAQDDSGYMTHYGSMSLKDLVAKCKEKGLKVGVYDNPLWIHGPRETKIEGTEYTFANLYYNGSTEVMNPTTDDMWFSWAVAENPGAKEYIDGFFKHYKELGIEYIRMDFLSWYEDGKDRNLGMVGKGYGRASYGRALSYIAESAKKYGIFTSLVMPHMYNDAEVEAKYGNMVRIVADTGGGGWWHCSAADKGKSYTNWPNCMNMFDGFTYWSHISGRDKVILDGDFIRLNTFSTDAEKETVVSLQLMAGGPVTVADQYNTIGNNTKFYTNSELLELNADRFVGKPLSNNLNDPKNQIWYGQMTNGDYVVGLFNRNDASATMSVNLSDLGIDGQWKARDLWKHADEGTVSSISANVAPHGCKIVRLSK